tara:strand:+ start:6644 stop:6811 length:168 start_codon:yes stop_codon:yes gene_type:complete
MFSKLIGSLLKEIGQIKIKRIYAKAVKNILDRNSKVDKFSKDIVEVDISRAMVVK